MNINLFLDELKNFVKDKKENFQTVSGPFVLEGLEKLLKIYDTRGVPSKIVIKPDDLPMDPRECDCLGTMVCWHHRYNLGDGNADAQLESDIRDSSAFRESWDDDYDWNNPSHLHEMAVKCGFLIQELYLYDHSGITMSTSSFSDRWDSGQVGFNYATPERIRKEFGVTRISEKIREKTLAIFDGEVEIYDQYIRGDVYQVTVTDDFDDTIDARGGFFGDDIEENGIKDFLDDVLDPGWNKLEILKPSYM